MDYTLELNKLKAQQQWLVQRGRTLLNRKEKVMDLGNGIGEVEEGKVIAELISFVDQIINDVEILDIEEFTIKVEKSS